MTTGIRLALTKIRDLVEATAPTTKHAGSSAFVHSPEATLDTPPKATRAFALFIEDGAVRGPYTVAPARHVSNATLAVWYARARDVFEHQIVTQEDAVALTAALLESSQWDTATTGIQSIGGGLDEADTLLPTQKQEHEGGEWLLLEMTLDVIEGV